MRRRPASKGRCSAGRIRRKAWRARSPTSPARSTCSAPGRAQPGPQRKVPPGPSAPAGVRQGAASRGVLSLLFAGMLAVGDPRSSRLKPGVVAWVAGGPDGVALRKEQPGAEAAKAGPAHGRVLLLPRAQGRSRKAPVARRRRHVAHCHAAGGWKFTRPAGGTGQVARFRRRITAIALRDGGGSESPPGDGYCRPPILPNGKSLSRLVDPFSGGGPITIPVAQTHRRAFDRQPRRGVHRPAPPSGAASPVTATVAPAPIMHRDRTRATR